ncbi:hypothetical protein [Aquabacterium sp.]|uniref:hypothetical protein n=1 Tax=Aquabacterium sp. TaxID=1872578 RepID=UPI0025B838C8|nr:hypothetical protein [Aquabacterium sp.]
MRHYLLIAPDGSVLQRGVSEEGVDIPVFGGATVEIIAPTDPRKPAELETTYKELRIMDYPPMAEQLGAIWKLLAANNLLSGEAEDIYNRIQAVKDSRPKD